MVRCCSREGKSLIVFEVEDVPLCSAAFWGRRLYAERVQTPENQQSLKFQVLRIKQERVI